MQQGRRSSRIAAQAAQAASASTTAQANSGGTTPTATTTPPAGPTNEELRKAVKDAERRFKEHSRGRGRGRGRSSSRGRGGKRPRADDEDSEEEEEELKTPSLPVSDDSSSSSSSSDEDSHQDPESLRKLWLYPLTKEHYGDVLPVPFKLANPQVCKDPVLWGLLWESLNVSPSSFVDAYELDGELTRAFGVALEAAYLIEDGEPLSFSGQMAQLKNFWKMLSQTFFGASEPSEILEGVGRLVITGASRVIQELDALYLSTVFGSSAGQVFRHNSKVRLSGFSKRSSRAVRAAIKAGMSSRTARASPSTEPFECKKCGKYIGRRKGAFYRHNKVCPKR